MNPLGMLEPVNIRDVWQGEASHFTPWLAEPENLERLGEALAMRLEPVSTETPVGPFYADIVCSNLNDNSTVLIENQLERTDLRLNQIAFWEGFKDYLSKAKSPITCQKPSPQQGMWHKIGRSGVALLSAITSGTKGSGGEIRAEFVIHDDLSGARLETLRSYEEELRAATGEEVYFEFNVDTAKRSKLYVRREGDWAKTENQQEIYQWLDTKHRALLEVLQPRLQNI